MVTLGVATSMAVQSIAYDLSFDPRVLSLDDVAAGGAMQAWTDDHGASLVVLAGVRLPRRQASTASAWP